MSRGKGAAQRKKRNKRIRMYEAQSGICHLTEYGGCLYPGVPMVLTYESPTQQGKLYASFDHLTPKSLGGSGGAYNLKLAHRECNMRRSSKDLLLC